jgi:hypothetical protein
MITRNVWRQRRDKAAEEVSHRFEERGELVLVSWRWPKPKRHPRFWRRMQAEMRFNWIESSKGLSVN